MTASPMLREHKEQGQMSMGTDTSQVHFHMIPKPNEKEGLGIGWPAQETDMDKLKQLQEQLKSKM